MKINEFITIVKEAKLPESPTAVSGFIKKNLEIKNYIPFAEKRELCEKVLNICNQRDENSGLIKVDSVSRYIVFTISIISKYTNLEFSSGEDDIDSLDEYDMLCQAGLFNPILDAIGSEYVACNNILNMMMEDIISNNNTLENVIGVVLGNLGDSVDNLLTVFADKVESMELDFNQIDIDKFSGLIDMFTKK
jgi:hypothetical protein